ncbi:hypothetical protein SETIT_8G251500v2 [Setaria italica]|uniref:Uncharacterized protein n=1 Tax=Setaria italica TaxID=4555 RepID=A0A368SBT2_SETIT|nr:hypothetical protein SETIT_8G251500v2 [Setaria italica]
MAELGLRWRTGSAAYLVKGGATGRPPQPPVARRASMTSPASLARGGARGCADLPNQRWQGPSLRRRVAPQLGCGGAAASQAWPRGGGGRGLGWADSDSIHLTIRNVDIRLTIRLAKPNLDTST